MSELKTLKEFGIQITSGQIMSRVSSKNRKPEKHEIEDSYYPVYEMRVIIPKAINSDGTIDSSLLPQEQLASEIDDGKMAKKGQIVMKLSTPYDAGLVDEESAGCIVPSFCAIVNPCENIDTCYLLAFLNSESCKTQLKMQVAGSVITVLSVGKISGIKIPVISLREQIEIGKRFMAIQKKRKVINEIIKLETMRNDVVFRNLEG